MSGWQPRKSLTAHAHACARACHSQEQKIPDVCVIAKSVEALCSTVGFFKMIFLLLHAGFLFSVCFFTTRTVWVHQLRNFERDPRQPAALQIWVHRLKSLRSSEVESKRGKKCFFGHVASGHSAMSKLENNAATNSTFSPVEWPLLPVPSGPSPWHSQLPFFLHFAKPKWIVFVWTAGVTPKHTSSTVASLTRSSTMHLLQGWLKRKTGYYWAETCSTGHTERLTNGFDSERRFQCCFKESSFG